MRFPANVSADLYNDLQLLDKDIVSEEQNYAGELLTRTDLIRFLIRLNAACDGWINGLTAGPTIGKVLQMQE